VLRASIRRGSGPDVSSYPLLDWLVFIQRVFAEDLAGQEKPWENDLIRAQSRLFCPWNARAVASILNK